MNKIVVGLFFLVSSVQAQDPIVTDILNDVSIDSLIYYSSAISGEFPVQVNGNAEVIASRNKNFPGNAIAADYIEQKFNEYGLTTSVQSFGPVGENVIGEQPGLLYPNQKVILCGHYDSMPANGTASPAADDDGSGTAAVIEAARVLSHYNFAYTIVYAAWDEEEYGLVGSNYYATQAENNGDSIVAVINVDAIAWDGDGDKLARVHTRNIANSVNLATVAQSMISTYGIDLQVEVNNPGATYSDHASFWNHDFSAVLIIEDFDNDGNPHYHTTTDRVEFFDTTYYEQISKWAFATTATMAVPLSGNVGVSETEWKELSVYPNPFSDFLTISGSSPELFNLVVSNMEGRIVAAVTNVELPYEMDLSGLSSGFYNLNIRSLDSNQSLNRKIIRR